MDISNIKLTIEEIKNIFEEKNFTCKNFFDKIKYIDFDNENIYNDSSWWIYFFIDSKSQRVLKIGKDTSQTKQRFIHHHYLIDGAQSTLAKDLYNQYVREREKSILCSSMNEEEIEELKNLSKIISEKYNDNGTIPILSHDVKKIIQDPEIEKSFNNVKDIIKKWMKTADNTEKYVISFPTNEKIFVLNFIEAYFQMKYEPVFEGYKKQNNYLFFSK